MDARLTCCRCSPSYSPDDWTRLAVRHYIVGCIHSSQDVCSTYNQIWVSVYSQVPSQVVDSSHGATDGVSVQASSQALQSGSAQERTDQEVCAVCHEVILPVGSAGSCKGVNKLHSCSI